MDIDEILFDGDKRAGDEVDVVLNTEGDIGLILFGKINLLQMFAGETHGLAVGQFAAGDNLCFDLCAVGGDDFQFEQGVVQQDPVARFQLVGKILITDGNNVLVTFNIFGRKGELFAFFQHDLAFFKGSDTEFRAFCIKHDGNRKTEFFSDFFDPVDSFKMFFVCPVRKIQAGNVHTVQTQLAKDFFGFAGRSDRAYDFCFTHILMLLFNVLIIQKSHG